MKPPCEIVTKKLLPSIRALIVRELTGKGYTQAEIAALLSISQPAVNYYLKLIETKQLEQKYPMIREPEIKRAAMEIAKSIRTTRNINESIAIICGLCREMRVSGLICAMHKRELPALPREQACGLCLAERVSIERIGKRVEVISQLAQAASILEGEAVEDLIPEIGMNIAFTFENPRSVEDVASFPGRIIRVKGRARATAIPEFGVSPTLSAILIKLSEMGSKHRCLLYMKNIERVRKAVRQLKFGYAETEYADRDWSAMLMKIAEKKDIKQIEVILDAGGVGLEPLAYIFARNPSEAIEKLRKVAGFTS